MNLTFRKLIILSALTCLLGVGIVYALGLGLTPQNQAQAGPMAEVTNEEVGLKLTLALEKAVYQLGERINLTLAITNISNQTVSYVLGRGGDRFEFRVYNSSIDDIYQWSRDKVFALGGDHIALGPGESLAAGQIGGVLHLNTPHYVWNQICNNEEYLSRSLWPTSEGFLVSPGTYYLVGQTGGIIGVNGKEFLGEHLLVMETPPIEITLATS